MDKSLLLLGDEAIAQGAIDAGLSGVYAYPGTPSTEITEYIQRNAVARERGLHSQWCTNEKRNDVFYVEFKSNGPIRPAKYYLTTANDTKSYPGRNPKSWKLMAKANEEDAWSTIATVTGDSRLPADNFKRVEYNLDVTGKQWQYFRFEISEIVSGYAVQLAEFDFGTN